MIEEITKEELLSKIDVYLSERKKSNSGWAPVELEEMRLLNDIIHNLITLKYEEDVDGDLPVEWHAVDRTKCYNPFLHYSDIEYPSKLRTLYDYVNRLRKAEVNLSIAQTEVTKITTYIYSLMHKNDELKNLVINDREE